MTVFEVISVIIQIDQIGPKNPWKSYKHRLRDGKQFFRQRNKCANQWHWTGTSPPSTLLGLYEEMNRVILNNFIMHSGFFQNKNYKIMWKKALIQNVIPHCPWEYQIQQQSEKIVHILKDRRNDSAKISEVLSHKVSHEELIGHSPVVY